MKKINLAISTFLIAFACFSQAPNKLNYQAVARNAAGTPLDSTTVNLRFTIHDISGTGTIVYQETQATTTNQFGLVTAQVGNGLVVQGLFSNINWGSGAKYLQVEISISGSAYNDMGTSQLISVPYALYAEKSGSGVGARCYRA